MQSHSSCMWSGCVSHGRSKGSGGRQRAACAGCVLGSSIFSRNILEVSLQWSCSGRVARARCGHGADGPSVSRVAYTATGMACTGSICFRHSPCQTARDSFRESEGQAFFQGQCQNNSTVTQLFAEGSWGPGGSSTMTLPMGNEHTTARAEGTSNPVSAAISHVIGLDRTMSSTVD